jgi:hypothetical protein
MAAAPRHDHIRRHVPKRFKKTTGFDFISQISAALFSATSRKMLYAFAASRPVNPSGVQPAITEEQLWKGLEYKARNPVVRFHNPDTAPS